LALAGCATATKIESGEQNIGERLRLTLEGSWNQISAPGMNGPNCQTWTMEGLPVDQLLIYSGLKNDEPIHAGSNAGGNKKVFKFRSDMQPDQIVALFEGMLTRDGSSFRLVKLEPASFGGGKGFRFEYSLVRKADNVELSGTATAVVNKGELFAILYQAPKLVFYPRHQQRVARIMQSARLHGA
ncbi:MAG TPA: hypothetical protein VEC01_03480, partial [Noviherbaspirillum sp.]|uniref:hypothetical protein n=1 Tax=Noviherbaspirillum sp. TaxID=1926288 RepID=UPI002D3740ED